jgi:uncharacterized LabA/DUF88 family protein
MKKAIILIDGSNFYFKLKDLKLYGLTSFDFAKFSQELTKKHQLVWTKYYVGRVRTDETEKVQKLFDQQRKLLAHLQKNGFQYSLGYLSESGGKFHEKGVDVQMAVDILVAAYEDQCDKIVLISSDTDLLPAIKQAQKKGKKIQYVGFEHLPSIALQRTCDSSKLLTRNKLKKFFK